MLCVTGGERKTDQLAERLGKYGDSVLQEVRLDLLERIDDSVFKLLGATQNLIVTCRSDDEGGGFSGTIQEKADIMVRALAAGPAYLDVEVSLPDEIIMRLKSLSTVTRLIASWHNFDGPGISAEILARFRESPVDLLKIAVRTNDTADLGRLREVLHEEGRPVLRIGMGTTGILSRIIYEKFGAPWTYVHADQAGEVAPGQLSWKEATEWRVDRAHEFRPIALIGGPQVMHSPGMGVYNRIFARRDLPYIYVPCVTTRPVETLQILEELGFCGCSVTMPAKEVLAGMVTEVSDHARSIGAINTICLEDGRRRGSNTDVLALGELLLGTNGDHVLVLGAGGVARAAVAACRGRVTVTSRTEVRARNLANEFSAEWMPWDQRGKRQFDVLVNATPVGACGAENPMPASVSLKGKTVIDAVYRPGNTPLIHYAVSQGARTISGLELWVRQGARQMADITGEPFSPEELREAIDE